MSPQSATLMYDMTYIDRANVRTKRFIRAPFHSIIVSHSIYALNKLICTSIAFRFSVNTRKLINFVEANKKDFW